MWVPKNGGLQRPEDAMGLDSRYDIGIFLIISIAGRGIRKDALDKNRYEIL